MKNNIFISFLKNYFFKIRRLKKDLVYKPELIEKPKGEKILILAPHFDDAILGCSGTLLKYNPSNISIVYLTDGSEGIPKIKDKKLVNKIRIEEAKKAMNFIGVKDIHYLNEPECESKINDESIEKLSLIIKNKNPDLIYLPWFLDNHVDHIKFNKILFEVYKRNRFNCNICSYEIWTPLLPNVVVDISKNITKKKEAIMFFESQLKNVNYLDTILGINKYRSIYNMKGKGYAETFLVVSIDKYFEYSNFFLDRN